MTQYALWLWPLLISGAFGLFNWCRIDYRWSWGHILQQVMICVCAVIGLTIGPEGLWAGIGWGVFIAFNIGQRLLINSIAGDLSLLRPQPAMAKAHFLKFLLWGPPAKYWQDLPLIESDYLSGNSAAAAERIAKWSRYLEVPRVQEQLSTYSMLGKSLLRDWQAVIDEFSVCLTSYQSALAKNPKQASYPVAAALAASRAYAELGDFKRSIETLENADLPSANYPRVSLDPIFLSFFALIGATNSVETVVKNMMIRQGGLPDFARTYWLGKAEAVNGDYQAAKELYDRALSLVPESDWAWSDRIGYQLKLTEERLGSKAVAVHSLPTSDNGEPLSIKKDAAARAEKIMRRCFAVSDIIYGSGNRKGIRSLVFILTLVFAVTYGSQFIDAKVFKYIYSYSFAYGVLNSSDVLHGEWWRLFSYQFLHANTSHLLMNIFGLIWLGKYVENIFGTKRFLVIYLGSGFLSGVAQMLISPDQLAVGASGAVMGVFGASAAATIRLKNILPDKIRKAELTWMLALAFLQIAFDQIVNIASSANHGAVGAVRIASFAHIGGIISGFILGFMLPLRKFEE